jgi:hypothetical protein
VIQNSASQAVNIWSFAAQIHPRQVTAAGPAPYLLGVAELALTVAKLQSRQEKLQLYVKSLEFISSRKDGDPGAGNGREGEKK